MNIYVASSWRNERQQTIVRALRALGHGVYEFKNPRPGDFGFHWSDIDKNWKAWTPEQFGTALSHPIAKAGFASDMEALRDSECVVLVLPCGRSAHLELGYAVGAGKKTIVHMEEPNEPELMYAMCSVLTTSLDDLMTEVGRGEAP